MKTFSGVFDKFSSNRTSLRKHEDSTSSTTESINEIFYEYTNQVRLLKIMNNLFQIK